jgi:hypothetical protein
MVISAFVVKSGLSASLGKHLKFITKALFGLSGNCTATIILSTIGGYPVGARGICALYENNEISHNEAVRMAYFAVGAGPGFLVTFVGTSLLGSAEIGFCLLASQIISVILLGLMNKYIFRNKGDFNSNSELNCNFPSLTTAIVDATAQGTQGTIEMCGMVVIFSAMLEIIEQLLISFKAVYPYIMVLFEVTNACNYLSQSKNILLIAFAVGFGGLCVHFQIFQALKNIEINKGIFFLFRIIQGLITCGLTYIFLKIFNISVPVYSSVNSDAEFVLSSSMIGSSLLIITGLCFIYTSKKFKY